MSARHDSTPPSSLQAGRRTFLGNTAALMIMQAVKFLFPLVTLPYLARVLEPDAYAVRAYVVSYMVFIQTLIDFGFAQYGTKLIAENAHDPQAMSSISTDVFIAKLLLALLGAAITLASAAFIPILGDNLAFVALSFGAIAAKSLLPDFVLQGLENMKAIAVRFSITQVIAVILIFLFVKKPSQLNLIAAFEGMASVVALAWTVAYLRKLPYWNRADLCEQNEEDHRRLDAFLHLPCRISPYVEYGNSADGCFPNRCTRYLLLDHRDDGHPGSTSLMAARDEKPLPAYGQTPRHLAGKKATDRRNPHRHRHRRGLPLCRQLDRTRNGRRGIRRWLLYPQLRGARPPLLIPDRCDRVSHHRCYRTSL